MRDRKKETKEPKEPRELVPSKRVKAAHRKYLKDGKPMSLKKFVKLQAESESDLQQSAEAWLLNKLDAR